MKTLRDSLIPLATVLTPNRYEAQILSGLEIKSLDDMKAAAQNHSRKVESQSRFS